MKMKDFIQLLILTVVFSSVLILLRLYVFMPVIIKGHSMDPTLVPNERVIALKKQPIERFDIVTFAAPDQIRTNYVKRVIGLPGDTIAYKGDRLYVNGKAAREPYLEKYKNTYHDEDLPFTEDFSLETLFGTARVPPGKIFVLGDNRRISKDSRLFGFIDETAVSGNVKFAFWPLERIGTP